MKNPLTSLDQADTTKEKIMLEASILFARRGYASVSMRDIAGTVGIKPPSLYNHFKSKEALYEAIIENIEAVYRNFYGRMDSGIDEAQSFAEVLDCLFSEVIDVYDIYIYYGFTLITTEQFRDEKANDVFNHVLVRLGIDYSKAKFDECVQKKWVRPFDTEGLATLFTNCVVMGTLMRTHEDMRHTPAYDARRMFIALKQHMLEAVCPLEGGGQKSADF